MRKINRFGLLLFAAPFLLSACSDPADEPLNQPTEGNVELLKDMGTAVVMDRPSVSFAEGTSDSTIEGTDDWFADTESVVSGESRT